MRPGHLGIKAKTHFGNDIPIFHNQIVGGQVGNFNIIQSPEPIPSAHIAKADPNLGLIGSDRGDIESREGRVINRGIAWNLGGRAVKRNPRQGIVADLHHMVFGKAPEIMPETQLNPALAHQAGSDFENQVIILGIGRKGVRIDQSKGPSRCRIEGWAKILGSQIGLKRRNHLPSSSSVGIVQDTQSGGTAEIKGPKSGGAFDPQPSRRTAGGLTHLFVGLFFGIRPRGFESLILGLGRRQAKGRDEGHSKGGG